MRNQVMAVQSNSPARNSPISPVADQVIIEKIATSSPKPPVGVRRPGAREMPLLTLVVAAVLFLGWLNRNEGHIVAETGAGYYLGIAGSLMMLMLLLYPLRKRLRVFRGIGGVRVWFRVHMLLGVIGPALVVLHSNFSLGSLNSTVALTAMLIVAGSGFIGRFFYARIHRGLYGRKHTINDLMVEITNTQGEFKFDEATGREVNTLMSTYQSRRFNGNNGILRSLMNILTGPVSRKKMRDKIMQQVRSSEAIQNSSGRARRKILVSYGRNLDKYFAMVARAETFTFYERMFALWHLLHLPLFIILVLAALGHVFAVHMF